MIYLIKKTIKLLQAKLKYCPAPVERFTAQDAYLVMGLC